MLYDKWGDAIGPACPECGQGTWHGLHDEAHRVILWNQGATERAWAAEKQSEVSAKLKKLRSESRKRREREAAERAELARTGEVSHQKGQIPGVVVPRRSRRNPT